MSADAEAGVPVSPQPFVSQEAESLLVGKAVEDVPKESDALLELKPEEPEENLPSISLVSTQLPFSFSIKW